VGLKRGDPTLTTVLRPVADGGDGTLGTVLAAGFEKIPVYVKGRQAMSSTLLMPVVARPRLSKWRKSVACNGFPAACPLL
jgi:hypothetical protein